MNRSELLLALGVVAAIITMWQLGMHWAAQQARTGLAPPAGVGEPR